MAAKLSSGQRQRIASRIIRQHLKGGGRHSNAVDNRIAKEIARRERGRGGSKSSSGT